jgi:Acyl-protein synthetase, LuxE
MLAARIADFVRGAGGSFDALAAQAFALHYERSPPLRRLADAAGLTPAGLTDWRQVPMVPTLAFKTQDLALGQASEEFHSSGTTGTASLHRHPHPELYRAVIDATFPAACLAGLESPPMLSLVPSRRDAPHSSLAFMLDHAMARWGGEGSLGVARPGGLQAQPLRGFLAARQRDRRPALVLATSHALGQLLDILERLQLSFRLPAGSRVFETGGTKGRSRELAPRSLRAGLLQRLGIAPGAVVREYGMTELTSHFYNAGGEGPFTVPPWVRTRVLDPATLEPAPDGAPGLLSIFDLANVGSALHVLTEDLAVAEAGGFQLVGRAAGAELRGCSLLSEELAG